MEFKGLDFCCCPRRSNPQTQEPPLSLGAQPEQTFIFFFHLSFFSHLGPCTRLSQSLQSSFNPTSKHVFALPPKDVMVPDKLGRSLLWDGQLTSWSWSWSWSSSSWSVNQDKRRAWASDPSQPFLCASFDPRELHCQGSFT